MAQDTSLQLAGTVTNPNRMRTRAGAHARLESVVLDRPNLLGPRRGVPYESPATMVGTPGDPWKRLFYYQDVLIGHLDNTLYRRVSESSWSSYSGTYEDPETGYRIRDVQQNKNLYFVAFTGVYKLDDVTGTPRLAGTPRPLDATGSTTGSSGFLADASAVGYRFTLYYTDANGNEIESAPSQPLVVTNTVGGAATRNVSLQVYIPSGLSTSYYWRGYRSAQVTPATAIPSDEMQVAVEGQLSSTDISNGYFTATDLTPDSLRGATLYTSPSQEGAAQTNDPPPLPLDMCTFKGHLFFFDFIGKERFFLNLLGTGDTALRFYVDASVGTTNGNGTLAGIASTATLRVGMRAKGTGVHANARITVINGANTVTVSPNSTATGTVSVEFQDIVRIDGVEYFAASATNAGNKEFLVSTGGTQSQNIDNTSRALTSVVNRNASAEVYGYIVSAFDEAPGKMLFEERGIGGDPFQLSTTAPEAFAPTLPTTDDGSQVSLADEKFNSAAISKFQQPEAVPVGQSILLGTSDAVRGLALRDAIIVLNIDDVGIITGTDITNFRYDQLDASCRVIAPESARVLNDAVYCFSNQGVVRISTQGVQIASYDIETDLVMSSVLANFEDVAFGSAHETDRAYTLYIPTDADDEQATFAWRLNVFTDAWSHAVTAASAAAVDPVTDELVLADQDVSLLRRERRSYDRTDFADDQLAVNITSSSGLTVNLTSAANLIPTDMLVQGANEVFIDAIVGNALTMREAVSWSNGAAIAYRAIDPVIEPVPYYGADPAVMKEFQEVVLIFREATFTRFTVSFATNFEPNFSYSTVVETADTESTYTVQPQGSAVLNEQPIRIPVPLECQYGHWLRLRISFVICRQRMAYAGVSYKSELCSADFQGAIG